MMNNYLQIFKEIGRSKKLLRSGWVGEHIKNPESVADHSFRVGFMVMILIEKLKLDINVEKIMKMVFIQGLAETITEDVITEHGYIVDIRKREQQEAQERIAIKKIFTNIGLEKQYLDVFDEIVNKSTLEAKIFWQIDTLEMVLQALEYEKEQGKNLEEFFLKEDLYYNAEEPMVLKLFKEIIKERIKK